MSEEQMIREYRMTGFHNPSFSESDTMDGTLACFHGFAMCINGYEEKGTLYGRGVHEKGEVRNRPELMQIAYEMGESV